MDNKSNIIETGKKSVEVSQLSSKECIVLDFSKTIDTIEKQRNSYLEFKLIINDEVISSDTVLFVKPKHFCFIDPSIYICVSEKEDKFILEISSKSFARFVELDLKKDDAIFSDNYFDLSAGDVKTIDIKKDNLSTPISLEDLREQLTIRSLFNTFEVVE